MQKIRGKSTAQAIAEEADSLDFEINVAFPELVCNQPDAPDSNCHGK